MRLGQVASRIGSVRGDIVGVDVLECDGGVAIDEFAVNLADAELLPMLVREIEEVDGASVEEVRIVGRFPDPRLDALESATRLCQVASVNELHEALVEQVRKEFLAEWAALIVGVGPEEEHGRRERRRQWHRRRGGHRRRGAPGDDHIEALALGVAASPLVASGAAGPEDLAAAPLATTGRSCWPAAAATPCGNGNAASSSPWPASPTGCGRCSADAPSDGHVDLSTDRPTNFTFSFMPKIVAPLSRVRPCSSA